MPPRPEPLAIVGGGNMARAIIAGTLGAGVADPGRLAVAEPDAARRGWFSSLGPATFASIAPLLDWLWETASRTSAQPYLLLAVKPQHLADVARDLAPLLAAHGGSPVIASILAGTPTSTIRDALGRSSRVVRLMPNMPASIGRGCTALCAGSGARPGDDGFPRALFSALGEVFPIDESLMDAFTAVAGSGPAYLFYLAEAMTRAAVELGFDPATADEIVKRTLAGASELLLRSGESPEMLRAAVTSKGGTTAAAAAVLDDARVMDALARALRAASDRGRELAGA